MEGGIHEINTFYKKKTCIWYYFFNTIIKTRRVCNGKRVCTV